MLLRASAACHLTCNLLPLRTAVRPVSRGGVLSIRNGALSVRVASASAGGLPGASETVTRSRYSPSAKAEESHEKYFSVNFSFSSFHSDSLTPRISTLKIIGSPFGSFATQRAPRYPFAKSIEGVVVTVSTPKAGGVGALRRPIGGRLNVGVEGAPPDEAAGKR